MVIKLKSDSEYKWFALKGIGYLILIGFAVWIVGEATPLWALLLLPSWKKCDSDSDDKSDDEYKHICYLWVDPKTTKYVVDHCDHPIDELIPVYKKLR